MNAHEKSDHIAAYVDQAAALLGLTLAPEHRPGVVASLTLLGEIAGPLLDFPLPETLDAAPVFEP
jgi:hypothetical protein